MFVIRHIIIVGRLKPFFYLYENTINIIIFLDQEEDELDREYGGIPQSFVYLPGTVSDMEGSSQLLSWDDIDQVNLRIK